MKTNLNHMFKESGDSTSADYEFVKKYKPIVSKFPKHRRRPSVPFRIYEMVLGMPYDEQERILDAYQYAGNEMRVMEQDRRGYFYTREGLIELVRIAGHLFQNAADISCDLSLQCNMQLESGLEMKVFKELGRCLRRGADYDIVHWKQDVHNIAIEGAGSFKGVFVQPYHIPEQMTVWTFENYLTNPSFVGEDEPLLFGLILWPIANRTGICVKGIGLIKQQDAPVFLLTNIENFYARKPALNFEMLALMEFMRLPIVRKEPVSYSHSARRKAEKEHRSLPCSSVITLRKVERERAETTQSDREYSCQWLRRGHWRKLHEPRKADGAEVTYVQPAICGPDDKPLKQPTQRIFEVRR